MQQQRRTALRFDYVPPLDGLRALAVLGVMAYHGGLAFVPGGFFGVDVFFVLSGFLITSLLVSEWGGRGTIALRAFWARRARRLLPALLVLLVAVALDARLVAAPGTYPQLRLDALSALFYVANWHFVLAGQDYFVQTGAVSPLLHTWSLAIEEQFYMVWPLVVAGVLALGRRRRGDGRVGLWVLFGLSVAGALASAAEMALVYRRGAGVTRVYFGTDTHAQSLLVGTALALGVVLWRQRADREASDRPPVARTPLGRAMLGAVGVAGAGAAGWAWAALHDGDPAVFRGGILLVGLATAAVIASTVLDPLGPVARVLGLGPLRLIGRISYGMYLWHFPLDLWLTHAATGLSGAWLFLGRATATVAVSAVSYVVVEQPVRTGTFFTAARAWVAGPVAVGATALVVTAGTALPAGAAAPSAPRPVVPAGAPVRVLMVGDSVQLTLGYGLAVAQARYGLAIDDEGQLGCGVAIGSSYRMHGQVDPVGWYCNTHPAPGYVQWPQAWAAWIARDHPDVVVYLGGRWEVVDRTFHGRWTNILDPAYAAYVKQQLELSVRIATAEGARYVMMTAPCYSSGEQPDGAPWPEDSPARLRAYNDLVRQVAAEHPRSVTVQDLDAIVCPHGRYTSVVDGVEVRSPDGVHFVTDTVPAGGTVLAPLLLPLWARLGHQVQAARAAGAVAPAS